jgi:methylmalonyl-CoA mutase
LLGVNRYPDLNEKAAGHFSKNENANKSCEKNKNIAEPIKTYRGSSAFEALRLKTEAMKQTPKVFLLTFGNLVSLKARAFFATNFFGCAGFKIQDNARFETIEAGIKAAIDSEAEIVVMCSSDEEYIETVPRIAKELKSKTILVLAGYPKEMIDTYKKEGIEHFIHLKSNLLEELQNFQKILSKNI